MKTAHDMGKYFSYSSRSDNLMNCCDNVGAARVRIKLDISGTRMTAKYEILHSLIRLNKALKMYQLMPRKEPVS